MGDNEDERIGGGDSYDSTRMSRGDKLLHVVGHFLLFLKVPQELIHL